jgi:nucleoside-diphosphate-sugar epimerase
VARVLIAGCGRLGIALGAELCARGDEVFGLRRGGGELPHGIHALQGDLVREDGIPELPSGLDAIVYAAAADHDEELSYRRTYIDGPRHVLRALQEQRQGPRRLVFVSSTAVYGQSEGEWVDEDSPTEPGSFRGRILLEGEAMVAAGPTPSVVARLGGIYGPGRTWLIDSVKAGRISPRPQDPPVYTNRIHEADCAGMLAHLLALDSPEPVYLGVDDEPAPRSEVAAWLAEQLGLDLSEVAPTPRRRDGNKRCSNARLRASGYRLRYPTFREGYAELLGNSAGP